MTKLPEANVENAQPFGEKVLVRQITRPEVRTPHGIFMPEQQSSDRSEHGAVVAVGPGLLLPDGTRRDIDIEIGDYILYRAGETVFVGPYAYHLVHVNAVQLKFKDRKMTEAEALARPEAETNILNAQLEAETEDPDGWDNEPDDEPAVETAADESDEA